VRQRGDIGLSHSGVNDYLIRTIIIDNGEVIDTLLSKKLISQISLKYDSVGEHDIKVTIEEIDNGHSIQGFTDKSFKIFIEVNNIPSTLTRRSL